MTAQTGKLPGYELIHSDAPQLACAPTMLQQNGQNYMMVHGDNLTTGVMQRGDDEAHGRVVLTIWRDPPKGIPFGTALSFTPDDYMIDRIVASLVELRDERRAHATQLAAAAIQKARGK